MWSCEEWNMIKGINISHVNIENMGGRDQSQVKIKFKKIKSVPKTYQKVITMTLMWHMTPASVIPAISFSLASHLSPLTSHLSPLALIFPLFPLSPLDLSPPTLSLPCLGLSQQDPLGWCARSTKTSQLPNHCHVSWPLAFSWPCQPLFKDCSVYPLDVICRKSV